MNERDNVGSGEPQCSSIIRSADVCACFCVWVGMSECVQVGCTIDLLQTVGVGERQRGGGPSVCLVYCISKEFKCIPKGICSV